jgi:hypothetical protein
MKHQPKCLVRRPRMTLATVLLVSVAYGQMHVGVKLNVDRQPTWGPTGYDHVEYYYFPDIDVYYNVPRQRFYYCENHRWTNSTVLPPRVAGFDLYRAYKVVVNEAAPYRRNAMIRDKYASLKGRQGQVLIRDSRDARYFSNAGHPEHQNWVNQQKLIVSQGNVGTHASK